MQEEAGSQVLFASYPMAELHIDSLKEKGKKKTPQENTACRSGLQLTCVFLGVTAAPGASDWGRASTAEQAADSVPQMRVLTSPLVHCNSVFVKRVEQEQKFPRCLSSDGPSEEPLKSQLGSGSVCGKAHAIDDGTERVPAAWTGSCLSSPSLQLGGQRVAGR